jgi:type II secretory pathway component PulM
MREFLGRLRALVEGLSPSERRLVGAGGGLAVALLSYLLVVQPVLGARHRAETRAAAAEQQFVTMLRLREEYDEINRRLSAVEHRIQNGPRGNIFTLLESLATRSSVKVESMEPQTPLASDRYRETKVEVALKSVTLAQTVSYLHQIESSEQLLSVKSLRLRTRRDKPELLDVTFTVSTFEPAS